MSQSTLMYFNEKKYFQISQINEIVNCYFQPLISMISNSDVVVEKFFMLIICQQD